MRSRHTGTDVLGRRTTDEHRFRKLERSQSKIKKDHCLKMGMERACTLEMVMARPAPLR